jgi:hypothetical protein
MPARMVRRLSQLAKINNVRLAAIPELGLRHAPRRKFHVHVRVRLRVARPFERTGGTSRRVSKGAESDGCVEPSVYGGCVLPRAR